MNPCVSGWIRPARRCATKARTVERCGWQVLVSWLVALAALLSLYQPSQAQDAAAAAWRVECGGDGKVLDCRALLQIVNREDNQTVALLTMRLPPNSKTLTMLIQLPLGISLVEPVQLWVDGGPVEKQSVQTCTAVGCFVGMPLNDKFLASMRSGTILKLTFQDTNRRPITIDVPLRGVGLAVDKIK
jgi:invasion protein IalB